MSVAREWVIPSSTRPASWVPNQALALDCGRDAHYWAPPAQNRTCSFPAYGSHLGCWTASLAAFRTRSAPVTRFPGTGSGTCGIGSRSPWPPPFAPPPPLPVARLCSAASLLLWRSLTSHARASSASVPHLPDAGQSALSLWPDMRPLRFRRVPFGRDGAFDPDGATASRMAMPHMLPSTGSERLGLRN